VSSKRESLQDKLRGKEGLPNVLKLEKRFLFYNAVQKWEPKRATMWF